MICNKKKKFIWPLLKDNLADHFTLLIRKLKKNINYQPDQVSYWRNGWTKTSLQITTKNDDHDDDNDNDDNCFLHLFSRTINSVPKVSLLSWLVSLMFTYSFSNLVVWNFFFQFVILFFFTQWKIKLKQLGKKEQNKIEWKFTFSSFKKIFSST